jgi:GH25 family lysozyme M1 (1,4-beta-N-acetylmuramidase)/archaellum component FlaC
MATTKGIDISKWQGTVDYNKVKKSTGFVIMKATEGYGYTDPKFKANQRGFHNINMPIGYYHFARPDLGNSPEKEADWFIKTIGTLKTGEVLALDYEVSYSDCVNWCKGFLDRVKSKTGVKPLLYINLATNNKYNWSKVVKGDYGLWLAYWDGSLTKRPKTDWSFIAMKQYGADTKINGISGNVDGNVFFGDIKTFKKYGYQGGQEQPNPPSDKEVIKELQEQLSNLSQEKDLLEDKIVILNSKVETLEKHIDTLEHTNGGLKVKLNAAEEVVKEQQEDIKEYKKEIEGEVKKYEALQKDYSRVVDEKNEAIKNYNAIKNGRWSWVIELLEKLFPARKSKK